MTDVFPELFWKIDPGEETHPLPGERFF